MVTCPRCQGRILRDSSDIYCWACGWRLSHTPQIVPTENHTDYSAIDHPNKRFSKEPEVHRLQAEGKTVTEISRILGIKYQTAKNYYYHQKAGKLTQVSTF